MSPSFADEKYTKLTLGTGIVMELVENEKISGVYCLHIKAHSDDRGFFTKVFSKINLAQSGLDIEIHEQYYSVSKSNVLRGLHFQAPPHDHTKIVHCLHGRVQDVLVDLRPGKSFGSVLDMDLNDSCPSVIIIPPGVAHGFLALQDGVVMLYGTTSGHDSGSDLGVRWDTCGINWKLQGMPIVSIRDQSFPSLQELKTPF